MDRHPHSSSRGPSKRRHPAARDTRDSREDDLRKKSRHSRDRYSHDDRRQERSSGSRGAVASSDYRGGNSGSFSDRRYHTQGGDRMRYQGHTSRRDEPTQNREKISRRECYDRPRNDDHDRPRAPGARQHRAVDDFGNRGQRGGYREREDPSRLRTDASGSRRDQPYYASGSRDSREQFLRTSGRRRRGENYSAESRLVGHVEETHAQPESERSRPASTSDQHHHHRQQQRHHANSHTSRHSSSSRDKHSSRGNDTTSATTSDRPHELDSLARKAGARSSDSSQASDVQPQTRLSSPSRQVVSTTTASTSKSGENAGYNVAKGVIKDLQLDESSYTAVNAATAAPNVTISSDVADKLQNDTNRVLVCGSVKCKLRVNFGPRCQNCRLLIGSGVYGDLTVNFAGGKNALVVIGNKCSVAGLEIHCNQANDFVALGSGVVCYGAKLVSGGVGAGPVHPPYIIIGDCCLVAAEVLVRNADSHLVFSACGRQLNRPERGVLIEPHVWLGQRATVLKDVTIGRGSIVALGSLVNCDVPRGHTARGTPAKCYPLPDGAHWSLNYSHGKRDLARNFEALFPAST